MENFRIVETDNGRFRLWNDKCTFDPWVGDFDTREEAEEAARTMNCFVAEE